MAIVRTTLPADVGECAEGYARVDDSNMTATSEPRTGEGDSSELVASGHNYA